MSESEAEEQELAKALEEKKQARMQAMID